MRASFGSCVGSAPRMLCPQRKSPGQEACRVVGLGASRPCPTRRDRPRPNISSAHYDRWPTDGVVRADGRHSCGCGHLRGVTAAPRIWRGALSVSARQWERPRRPLTTLRIRCVWSCSSIPLSFACSSSPASTWASNWSMRPRRWVRVIVPCWIAVVI